MGIQLRSARIQSVLAPRRVFLSTAAAQTHPASSEKPIVDVDDAVNGLASNITVLAGGFGLCGVPQTIIDAIARSPNLSGLTVASNNAGTEKAGLGKLFATGKVKRMICSYIGKNKAFDTLYKQGKIELELNPQGTLAERIRAASAGIPAFYTPTGYGTWVQEGKLPVRYDSHGKLIETTNPREVREFDGRAYIMERALKAELAIVRAFKVDTLGNCWFRGTARNFNSIMARAAKHTIVEAEHIVQAGEIAPEDIHLPGIYVSQIVKATAPKQVQVVKTRSESSSDEAFPESRLRIAKRAAKEFEDGSSVNLGVGMPTLAASFLSPDINVTLQSENGILGLGPYPTKDEIDADYVNAGKETVTLEVGASVFSSENSFALIRSGRVSMTVLGAMQVSKYGDLANWALPNRVMGMGGAMDLVSNPQETKVLVLTDHQDKNGNSKIVDQCSFPLTGVSCVRRIISELAVFDVDAKEGLTLIEIHPSVDIKELKARTGADFKVSPNLKDYDL